MKFIVDEMPKSKSECLFSKWEPYPPFMEKTGHFTCPVCGVSLWANTLNPKKKLQVGSVNGAGNSAGNPENRSTRTSGL